jgi:hypothetical protein
VGPVAQAGARDAEATIVGEEGLVGGPHIDVVAVDEGICTHALAARARRKYIIDEKDCLVSTRISPTRCHASSKFVYV